jgi:hypothetical protein
MVIAEQRRPLLQVVLFWLTVVALAVALVYLIRSDHLGWRKEVFFSLRLLAIIVVYFSIAWALRTTRSRLK